MMQITSSNAWIAIDHGLSSDPTLTPYTLRLKGERSLYQAITDGDWVLILNAAGHIMRVGQVLRVRSDLETTTLYLDRVLLVDPVVSISLTSLNSPASAHLCIWLLKGSLRQADLLLNFHPVAIRVSADVTPFDAG